MAKSRVKAQAAGIGLLLWAIWAPALAQDKYRDGPLSGIPYLVRDDFGRTYPYVNVYRSDRYREYLRQKTADPSSRPAIDYEWRLPVSTLEGTRDVARRMLLAWQRLEERTYQHVMHKLSYVPGATELLCEAKKLGWGIVEDSMKLNPETPEAKVSTLPQHFPEGYAPPLESQKAASDGALRLDWYSYYYVHNFRVHPDDFCDNISGEMTIFIPGIKLKFPPDIEITTPGYPWPLFWTEEAYRNNAMSGVREASANYTPDYVRDVYEAVATPKIEIDLASLGKAFESLLKGDFGSIGTEPKIYIPIYWTSHEVGAGVTTAPVIKMTPSVGIVEDVRQIMDKIVVRSRFQDRLLETAKWAYYVNSFRDIARRLGISISLPPVADAAANAIKTIGGFQYRSEIVKGIWPLEELKRWFPPTLPQIHESLGYTTYFQAFAKPELTMLPDPGADWGPGEFAITAFMRSIHIWNIAFVTDFNCGIPPCVYPDPASIFPIPIAPYVITYAGPRYYWDWVSVPDGYPIPRVKGVPLLPSNLPVGLPIR